MVTIDYRHTNPGTQTPKHSWKTKSRSEIHHQTVGVPRSSLTQLRKHELRHKPHHKLHMLNHVPQIESL